MKERKTRGLGPMVGMVLAGLGLAGEAQAQTHLVEKGVNLAWDARHESLAPADIRVVDSVARNGRVFTLYQQPIPAIGDPRDSVLVEATDASSGTLLWSSSFRSNPDFPEVPLVLAAAPDGSAAFVASDILVTQGISTITHVALNRFEGADGQRTLLDVFTGKFGNGAGAESLAVGESGERVFLATRSLAGARLDAYDAFTGFVEWTREESSGSYTVLARPGVLFMSRELLAADNELLALEPDTGAVLWAVSHPTAIEALFDASADGSLVVTGRRPGLGPTVPGVTSLIAWDGQTGAVRWSKEITVDRMVVAQDGSQVFTIDRESAQTNVLEARFAGTGNLHWSRTLNFGPGSFSAGLSVDIASRSLGVLFRALDSTGNEIEFLECYDSSSAQRLWTRVLGLEEDLDLALDSSTPGFVVTGTDRMLQPDGSEPLVALQAGFPASGLTAWSRSTSTMVTTVETADDRMLSQDGAVSYTVGRTSPTSAGSPARIQLVANDSQTGAELWSVDQAVDTLPTNQSVAVSRNGILSNNGAFVYTRSLVGRDEQLSARRSKDGVEILSETLPLSLPGTALGGTSHLLDDRGSDTVYVVYRLQSSALSPHALVSIAAFDGSNFAPLWDVNLDVGPAEDTPHHAVLSADGSRLYVAGRLGDSPITGSFLHAVDAATGALEWTHLGGISGLFGERVGVSADGQTVYLVENGGDPSLPKRHRVRAVDAATGTALWIGASTQMVGARDLVVSDATQQVIVAGTRFTSSGVLEFRDYATIAYDSLTGASNWEAGFDSGFEDDATHVELSDDGITAFVVGASSPIVFPALTNQVETNTLALDLVSGAELWRAEPRSLTTDVVIPVGLEYDSGRRRLFVSGHDRDQDIATFAYEVPDLIVDREGVSLSQGGTVELALRPGLGREADPYYLLGSAASTAPGVDLGGGLVLPLEPDAYFFVTLAAKASALSGFQGSFDARGIAAATLTIPAGSDPALAGTTLYHAFLAADVLGFPNGVSNAVGVVLTP